MSRPLLSYIFHVADDPFHSYIQRFAKNYCGCEIADAMDYIKAYTSKPVTKCICWGYENIGQSKKCTET